MQYTPCDHKRNADILEELKVEPVDQKQRRYKSNWLRHGAARMNSNRMPKIILNYRPNGRRPMNRLKDEAEMGLSESNW